MGRCSLKGRVEQIIQEIVHGKQHQHKIKGRKLVNEDKSPFSQGCPPLIPDNMTDL